MCPGYWGIYPVYIVATGSDNKLAFNVSGVTDGIMLSSVDKTDLIGDVFFLVFTVSHSPTSKKVLLGQLLHPGGRSTWCQRPMNARAPGPHGGHNPDVAPGARCHATARGGGREAKTTREPVVHQQCKAIQITTPMEDVLSVIGWSLVLPVCSQPRRSLPGDIHLHRLLVSLLDISTRRPSRDHAAAAGGHSHGGVVAPQLAGQPLLGMGGACAAHGANNPPPSPPATGTVGGAPARGSVPVQVPHQAPYPKVFGAPSSRPPLHGPALHKPGALLLELGTALQTHLREHFRGHAMLHP